MDLSNILDNQTMVNCIKNHLGLFIKDNELIYENPRSEPSDGAIYGIEGTLPFAVLARMDSSHPMISRVIDFWNSSLVAGGIIFDGDVLTAEGSYTVAYPMAVIAAIKKNKSLAEIAFTQLLVRRDHLKHQETLYLRWYKNGNRTFGNWARAYSWYMLGLVRSLVELRGLCKNYELEQELIRISEQAIAFQRRDGLWSCFLGEEDVDVDTSGSSGIAAALAIGVKHGFLEEAFLENCRKAYHELKKYLTPDGFLMGAAQSNRGGEELQRSNYRVISQMGMGLMAQLAAHL